MCAPIVFEFYANFHFDGKVMKISVRDFELEFNAGALELLLNIPSLGFGIYLKNK